MEPVYITELTKGEKGDNGSKNYKVYSALLTQAGTAAPTIKILENTIGTIVSSYSGVGLYRLTLTGAFTTNKASVIINSSYDAGVSSVVGATIIGNDYILISSFDFLGAALNSALVDNFIEIRVYS